MSCVCLPHKFIHVIKTCLVHHEVLNITILTRTLLLVSVALDSELSLDSSFICTHTQQTLLWCFRIKISVLVFVYDVYCKPLQSEWEYKLAPRLISSFRTRRSLGTRLDGRASQTIFDINSTSATAAQIGCVVVNKCVMLWLGCMVSYASIF